MTIKIWLIIKTQIIVIKAILKVIKLVILIKINLIYILI
jgi:hypothetical protein